MSVSRSAIRPYKTYAKNFETKLGQGMILKAAKAGYSNSETVSKSLKSFQKMQ